MARTAFTSILIVPARASNRQNGLKKYCTLLPRPTTAKAASARSCNTLISCRVKRVNKADEAFVTCTSCGSDEVVSASDLISRGSLAVRCTQCNNRWTATVDQAITSTGASLISTRPASESDEATGENKQAVTLYISGLGPKADNALLRQVLQPYGDIIDARVIYDKATGRSRGFGFVTIGDQKEASAIMDILNGDSSTPLGPRLRIREARQ